MMTNEFFNCLIRKLVSNAEDSVKAYQKNRSEFDDGRVLGYYEVLDTIKNRLIVEEYDLHSCGLDINLEKRIL